MVSTCFRTSRSPFSQNYSLSNVLKIHATNYLAPMLHIIQCEANFLLSSTSLGECNTKNVAKDCIKQFEIQEANFILFFHPYKKINK